MIRKAKLPKGLSYPLQTQDIVNGLNTESIAVFYNYAYCDSKKLGQWDSLCLFDLRRYPDKVSTVVGHLFSMSVYSIESKLRKKIREVLCKEVLPFVKKWQELNNKGKGLSVYYQVFHEDYQGRGGIYIEEDRYGPKKKLLYRNENFNIDEVIYEK